MTTKLVQLVVRGSSLLGLGDDGSLWITADATASGDVRWKPVRQTFTDRDEAVRALGQA